MDKVKGTSIFSPTAFLLSTTMLLTILLTGCITQKYENDTPVVQNQANRDEMAATRISLGLGYLKMGNMAQAKLNLEKAKKFSPELVQVYTAFAHYYEVVGENELANQSYEKALSIKLDDADTLNNYGVFLCRQDNVAAAEVQFLRAIAVPSYLLVAQSYENLSSCYLQIDDFIKAEQYLNKAIAHSPNRTATLSQMVRLQYAMSEYGQAKKYQQKFERNTRRFTPDSLALAYKVYRKLGQRRTAKNYATMLMKMYPQSWESKQYLLNELELIEADNLAKRYQLSQRLLEKELSLVSGKSKKRIVKLSPKSKAKASATASLTAMKQPNALNTTSVKVTETTVNVAEASTLVVTQEKLAESVKIETQAATQTAVSPKIETVAVTTDKSLLIKPSAVNAAMISSAVIVKQLNTDDSEKENPSKDTKVDNELNSDVNSNVSQNVDANSSGEKLPIDNTEIKIEVDTEANAEVDIAANDEINAALTSTALASSILTNTEVKESQTEIDNLTGTLTHVSTESHIQTLNNDSPVTTMGEPTSTMPIPAKRDAPLPETFAFVDTDKTSLDAVQEEEQVLSDVKADESTVINVDESEITPMDTENEQKDIVSESTSELAENTQVIYHQVVDGETLYAVSMKYNVKMSALRKWNKLSAKSKLQINKKLYVVNPETVANTND